MTNILSRTNYNYLCCCFFRNNEMMLSPELKNISM